MSSAYGYGQFIDGTWNVMIRRYGEKYGIDGASAMSNAQTNAPVLRTNRDLQAAMLAEFTRENSEQIRDIAGPDPDANVYAMHNLGNRDGERFLRALRANPDALVSDNGLMSRDVIQRNQSLYMHGPRILTVREAYERMGEQLAPYQRYADQVLGRVSEQGAPGATRPVALQAQGQRQVDVDSSVEHLQQNLNTLGIRDARGHALVVDGDPGSRTNEAISEFRRQNNLTGNLSNADLLIATQAALATRQALDAGQALRGILPENARTPGTVDGIPDYLLPGRGAVSPAPLQPRTAPAADDSVRVPPMPPVDRLEPGATGAAVFALQQHLRVLNARDAEGRELQADRDYGPRTQQAVENFQLWTGLSTTGIADRATLDALKTHAAHALDQRAKGIPQSEHIADNLGSVALHARGASTERPTQGRGAADSTERTVPSVSLTPYGDPSHPRHALYAELKTALEGMGHRLPEDRLHQITAQMEMNGMRAGPQNRYAIREDNNTFYAVSDIPGFRAHQALGEPAPPIEQTMQQVQAHQALVQQQERQWQQGQQQQQQQREAQMAM